MRLNTPAKLVNKLEIATRLAGSIAKINAYLLRAENF